MLITCLKNQEQDIIRVISALEKGIKDRVCSDEPTYSESTH